MMNVSAEAGLQRRKLPKLYACSTKGSLEHFRNKALYNLDTLDAKAIRRLQIPFHECLIQEMKETGYLESSTFLQNVIYDNIQLVNEDELGIVVDLRRRKDYLEHITENLMKIEKEHDKGNLKTESLLFLRLARYFTEREKGNLWLAEKLYLVSIAVASQLMTDGGRQKNCCKYFYSKFLLDKFPGLDDEEPFNILSDIRNSSIGKDWLLYEADESGPRVTVFCVSSLQLNRVLMNLSKKFRLTDPAKAERLARLAERRARDSGDIDKEADAVIQIGVCQLIMNNLNNAQNTFARALALHNNSNNIDGICETKMHLATVMQRLNRHQIAEKLLTEMGVMAMEHGLRRHLGRALHLLGELHLMREKPELGTQYLCEAFACFMGFTMITPTNTSSNAEADAEVQRLNVTFVPPDSEKDKDKPHAKDSHLEEAERSRLMAAVCSAQEKMASYFSVLRESNTCTLAKVKIMEWKLSKLGWWIPTEEDKFQSCPCPLHNLTPLDVMRMKLALKPEPMSRPQSYQEIRGSFVTTGRRLK